MVDARVRMQSRADVKPVLKWAGGKRQLLEHILPVVERCFPKRIEKYYEPFVGGAAVFFALFARDKFERARLSDMNADLIGVYRALRDDAESVIAELSKLESQGFSRETYYKVRDKRPTKAAARAARLIYLNRTGYNGLYRVNSSGEFNVPYGSYKNPRILDQPRLLAAARALQGVEIEVEDFEASCAKAKPGDFVYFDPPYVPVSKTASFAAYHSVAFTLAEHARLAQTFARLSKRGVQALLSNSDTPETQELYRAFQPRTVQATRAINSNASRRGSVPELLVHSEPSKKKPKARSR
ncbi:MAG TPA: DNA adenine methylase [Polyangiaceae bacterium]|nr:DNA adenine methylase [Polyangiaceae bacterium]